MTAKTMRCAHCGLRKPCEMAVSPIWSRPLCRDCWKRHEATIGPLMWEEWE